MTPCTRTRRLQAYLDGDLPEAEARALGEHLAGCARCAAELAALRRVFAMLAAVPLDEPSPGLTERVLERVVPSRARRRRWVRAFGWGYGTVLAGCLAAIGLWALQPGGQAVLSGLTAAASRRLFEAVLLVPRTLGFVLLHLTGGWNALGEALQRFVPFLRALDALMAQSGILVTLGAALAACVVLLWWMRPREARAHKEIRHVLLGF
jgi:hypothetical protein